MMIQVENLVKRYGDVVALDHFNLQIAEGEIFGLLGPNGSGKTTAINCMLSLLKYDRGAIELFGRPMGPDAYDLKREIGVVMQNVAVAMGSVTVGISMPEKSRVVAISALE